MGGEDTEQNLMTPKASSLEGGGLLSVPEVVLLAKTQGQLSLHR